MRTWGARLEFGVCDRSYIPLVSFLSFPFLFFSFLQLLTLCDTCVPRELGSNRSSPEDRLTQAAVAEFHPPHSNTTEHNATRPKDSPGQRAREKPVVSRPPKSGSGEVWSAQLDITIIHYNYVGNSYIQYLQDSQTRPGGLGRQGSDESPHSTTGTAHNTLYLIPWSGGGLCT